ncbi:MAG: PEP-CTERM sorting domain-containing protein [Pirellulaceae bacterium]|nr:PEP-CTERM sorting domain-containing protein [Pirellulaceae bacterium]
MLKIARFAAAYLAAILLGHQVSQAALIINVNYTGDPQYAAAFSTAASTWQNLLGGFQNGLVVSTSAGSSYSNGQTVSTVFITANVEAIDGVGNVLGSAGPTAIALDAANYTLATNGLMRFDSADVAGLLSGGQWENVILHEMAHVLGFGTLWTNNGVYANNSGEFTGANATVQWQTEFGRSGTPDVELGGGVGTANGHWNEVDGGGLPTGIVDGLGRDLRDELMTGWLNPNTFISNMTVASFRDIGFTSISVVPEPSSLALACLGFGAIGYSRRRRAKN